MYDARRGPDDPWANADSMDDDRVLHDHPLDGVRANPWMWEALRMDSPERTAARYVYKVVREIEAFPDLLELLQQVDKTGVKELFPPFDWDTAVGKALKACRKRYLAPRRTHPVGMFLELLRKLIPPERLVACPVKVEYEDVDIALIYYTLAIGGKRRDRLVGHCGSNVLPSWFVGLKSVTKRGCNKQKALTLHNLMLEYRLIRVFDTSYCPKKFRKSYTFGVSHPDFKEQVTGWESVPLAYKKTVSQRDKDWA